MRTRLALLLLSACATLSAEPAAPKPQPVSKPAPPSESERLATAVAALEHHAGQLSAERDDALWSFWLGGSAPQEDPFTRHGELLVDASLETVRRARALRAVEARRLDRLEALIVGERVSKATEDAHTALTQLTASLRFNFEGREVPFRELNALLSNERNPQRRATLWQASAPAARLLEAAHLKLDRAVDETLSRLGTDARGFSQLLRQASVDASADWATRFLASTQARWRQRLGDEGVSGRADIPAWLRASAALDAAFPKARIVERGTQTLADLGFYGLSHLTLDLTDGARKQPVPLTVSGVRMSFKPRGGWRDQQALLAELGRALALRHNPHAESAVLEASAALFASLVWNRAWLEQHKLPAEVVSSAVSLGSDAVLYSTRLAAGGVAFGLGDADGINRALQFTDEPARSRLELEPLFQGIQTLRAQAHAFALLRHLEVQAQGPTWWSHPSAAQALRTYWESGHLPDPVRRYAENAESLLAALGAPRTGGVGPDARASSAAPPLSLAPAGDAGAATVTPRSGAPEAARGAPDAG